MKIKIPEILLIFLFIIQGCCVFEKSSWLPLPYSKDKKETSKDNKTEENTEKV